MPESAKTKDFRQFALTRSCNAAIAANDNSRPMAQYALVINGAAASAVIAFLTKEHIDPVIFRAVPWTLACYALGVATAAVAMYVMTEALDQWNCFWELTARGEPQADIDAQEAEANRWWNYVRILFFVSIAWFVMGSGSLAIAILRMPLPT